MSNLAFKTLLLTVILPIWLVLCLLFRPDYSGVTLQSVLLAVPAIVLGFGISFLIGAIITCMAFWTTRVFSLNEFYHALYVLFGGAFVPLDLLPLVIRQIAQFLPFQLLKYFPIQLILGRLSTNEIALNFALAIGWFSVMLLLFQLVWRLGVKRFSAVGA